MIVVCPQCETNFDIPEDKYRPGRKARCSSCGNVFSLPELAGPGVEEQAASVADDATAALDADIQATAPEEAVADEAVFEEPAFEEPAPAGQPEEATENDPEETPPLDAAPPASVDDAVFDASEEKPAARSRKKLFIILAAATVLVLLILAGVLLFSVFSSSDPVTPPTKNADTRTSLTLDGKSAEGGESGDDARQAAVRRLALEKVRQYTVTDNEKTGRMVVIEGSVVNNFDTPKDLILLEITLYDEKGNPLVLREQYCGVTLSLMQLTTQPKAALENALNDQRNILINNMGIPPGGRVPFMTVFFNLPSAAYEFEVKIVDAKDSAPASEPASEPTPEPAPGAGK
ncbi:MAG: hypothetical protein DELT_02051 [Desulfovibrio sp.]